MGKGCDATAYDSGLTLAFASSGDGTITVLSGESNVVVHSVATQPTARTVDLDVGTHRIYTVAVEYESTGHAPTPGVRQKLKPRTFSVIAVQRLSRLRFQGELLLTLTGINTSKHTGHEPLATACVAQILRMPAQHPALFQ